MPRSFDPNNQRINTPKPGPVGPPVANQGRGQGLRQPPTIKPVQPRTRKDEITRPMAQGSVPSGAPSHTKPMGPPDGSQAGLVEQKRIYQGPGGEKVTVQPSQEQQMMGEEPSLLTGGQQAPGTVSPPMAPSPLGMDSPVEQTAQAGGFRHGQNAHIRKLTQGSMAGMNREQQIEFERKAVRDFQAFGDYEGSDDPNSPPPPIRVGKHSYNPETGHWVEPEGEPSVLAQMSA